jgi:hypothetical protein
MRATNHTTGESERYQNEIRWGRIFALSKSARQRTQKGKETKQEENITCAMRAAEMSPGCEKVESKEWSRAR